MLFLLQDLRRWQAAGALFLRVYERALLNPRSFACFTPFVPLAKRGGEVTERSQRYLSIISM